MNEKALGAALGAALGSSGQPAAQPAARTCGGPGFDATGTAGTLSATKISFLVFLSNLDNAFYL